MDDIEARVSRLAADLIAIDSRSSVSNIAVADRIERELAGFEVVRVDYTDPAGIAKRGLIAHKGRKGRQGGGYGLSGHMDTVPDTGWTTNPWDPRIDAQGMLHGLGSTDMKGPLAACIVAAQMAGPEVPATLLITTDEETTKDGARALAAHPFALSLGLRGVVVAEPTSLTPVRGHRSSTDIRITAEGVQAHSSTGKGLNANWALIPFMTEMKAIYERLRTDPALQDPVYDPPFSDFNLIVDNHGAAVNVTVPLASARIKFRYSKRVDPAPILAEVRAAAARHGVSVTMRAEGPPPELEETHPLIARCVGLTNRAAVTVPFGTDASELQAVAPCVVLGPGSITVAHTPDECVRIAELAAAVPLFGRILAAGVA